MPALMTKEGRRAFASALRGTAMFPGGTFAIILSKTNFTETVDGPAGFTEATFTGYAPITRAVGTMGAAALVGDDAVVALDGGTPFQWDCTGAPDTIYGWALVNPSNGFVYACEKYSAFQILSVGSRHSLFASIKQSGCA